MNPFLRGLQKLRERAQRAECPDRPQREYPYFGGGGLHQIEPGGFLKVHVDFNVHRS